MIIDSINPKENKPKTEDGRNIIDYYWYWKTEQIKADLDSRRHNFSVLCSNLYNDFNLSVIVRNSNAFLAKEVIIYGRRSYDKRGAVGTQNYTNFKYVKTIDDVDEISKDSIMIGVDNIPSSVPIENFVWPSDRHVIMAFGQEQVGLPEEIIRKCQSVVYISQYGSVRSLNVGCSSAIAMFSYCLQKYCKTEKDKKE
jgi:tRNA G18 (ribose-2'-O)-methylase SpoU